MSFERAISLPLMVRGEARYNAKLTENNVLDILEDRRSNRDIARAYSVSEALVSRIKTGKIWKHITRAMQL